ncbi:permease-like cell division protein FtsX [Actinoplanes derwentensis]|uniref:FtsX extracellular domain-containing protein n=1 Tax=Actinoplanes derwentensis TaxID=113562 RepID=A0A1H1UFN0_9ACTN|nr:permease-like cell division protein FtsX [Actinoplanes derwentensis]GID85290.1 hypothetical protein Ade03nite_42140 [Actinoplanes derwentensis]SDS71190.1 hypothetical protein SAMN04489716_1423 [Actinoplanes derwentensis]
MRFDDTIVEKQAPWDSEGSVSFDVPRRPSGVLWAVVIVGGLAGALATWLFTGWVARRVESRPELPVPAAVVAGIALLMLLPTAAFAWLWPLDDSMASGAELGLIGLHLLLSWTRVLVLLTVLVFALPAAFPQPRRLLAAGVATLALAAVVFAGSARALFPATPAVTAGSCVPAVPAADDPHSSWAFVFIRSQTIAEQRNYIEAAISRNPGVYSYGFVAEDPASQPYRDAYRDGRPLPAGTGTGSGLPYFWQVDLNNPGGLIAGLAAEVSGMPGVIAVRAS